MVKEILEKTKDLYNYLRLTDRKKVDRDEFIEKIQQLIDQRQQLLQQLKPPYSEADKEMGSEIAKYEKQIDIMLKGIMYEIKKDISQLKVRKMNHSRYENPYGNLTGDGMFLDKRK